MSPRSPLAALTGALVLTLSPISLAGDAPQPQTLVDKAEAAARALETRAETRQFRESSAAGPVSDAGIPRPALMFTAAKEDKKAEATCGFVFGDSVLDLKVSTPLQEGAEVARPLSLDGLANGASLQLGFSRLVWPFKLDEERLAALCEGLGKPDGCDLEDFAGPRKQEFRDALGYSRTLQTYGVKVAGGRNDFKWIDAATLEDRKERHNNWSVGALAGLYDPALGFLAARFDYQGAYEPSDELTVCRPIADTAGEKCQDRALAGPTKTNAAIVRLEWRRFLLRSRVALNPVVSRDLKNKVSSIEVPLYFLQNTADKGLNGGVSFGWRSDQKGLVARVFVGASLGAIGQP